VETILIAIALVLANLRALIFIFLFPDTTVLWGPAWIEILLWSLVTLGLAGFLFRHQFFHAYFAMWRKNWPLGVFILLTFSSIIWSIDPVVTLFRALELLFATLIAAYVAVRFQVEDVLDLLFWFGAGLFILSIALVYGAPKTGTMYWAPFDGAWRGVYWHRNHLASITALLSGVYLCRSIFAIQNRNSRGILDGFLYLVSLIILYSAKSVTGYIVFLVLNGSILGIFVWLQVAHRLERRHYVLILGGIAIAAILVLLNLDFLFGLFHRDTTLTGRVGLWSHLMVLASQNFWLGHGFGAVWTFDSFREQIRVLVNWTSQPLIGDNGFLDIFLHLGLIGLLLLISISVIAIYQSVRYGLAQKTLFGFFPLLVIVYALFANITFSLFAETEVFVWTLIVVALFITTPLSSRMIMSV
jgi:O-antigen ligase